MTSKFSIDNRELLQRISSGEAVVGIDFGNLIVRELAAFRLAAMDSESWCLPLDYLQGHKDGLEWASQLAEANHPETGDWLYDDPIELAKAIRKGPDMPPAQPAPVVPEEMTIMDACKFVQDMRLFDDVSVIVMRTWNACRATMLQASPVCTCPSGDGSLRWPCPVHPGKSPVVPDDVLDALQEVARIRVDLNDLDGDFRGVGSCLWEAEERLLEIVARRSSMLSGGKS